MKRSVVLLGTLLMILSIAWVSPVCAADSLSVVSVAEKRVQLTATMGIEQIRQLTCENGIVYDVKSVFPAHTVDGRL